MLCSSTYIIRSPAKCWITKVVENFRNTKEFWVSLTKIFILNEERRTPAFNVGRKCGYKFKPCRRNPGVKGTCPYMIRVGRLHEFCQRDQLHRRLPNPSGERPHCGRSGPTEGLLGKGRPILALFTNTASVAVRTGEVTSPRKRWSGETVNTYEL